MSAIPKPYPFDLPDRCPAFIEAEHEVAGWCARGFAWLYGFNHEEAANCFRAAADLEDGLAIAWWGIAISSGPFMNMPWEWFTREEKIKALQTCHGAVNAARARSGGAPEAVRALIDALARRFPSAAVPDDDTLSGWERSYADAMQGVYDRFGDDPDIAALYVDSQIMLTPWELFDIDSRAPNPQARTAEIHAALERGLTGAGGDHIGLLHYDIHFREMSPTPERALESALRLEMSETGDAGHLAHMPSHIHALLGDFEGAARCSRRAVALDLEQRPYLERAPFYRTLHCHDAHMLMFAGMQTGNLGDAAHGADVIADLLRDVLIEPPTTHMMMTLEGYLSTIPHVDIRFGRWQTVLDAVFDGDPAHRPVSWAMHHYARAVASAALGMFDSARQAAEAFDDARAAVPVEYAFFNNPADAVLTVADLMMRGEMAYHAGEIETAFDLLQQAINAEDGLGYNEPRAWMHPPRHALGALMLEQGRVAEALAIYECDLGHTGDLPVSRQNRGNIWSLAGLAECLHRLGGEDTGAADAELAAAMRLADRAVTSSCFCRGCAPAAGTD